MERYTEWRNGHGCGLPGKDCYTRLAEYEDTGLEPSRINSQFINDVIDENKRLKAELDRIKASAVKIVDVKEDDLERLVRIMQTQPICTAEKDQHPTGCLRPCEAVYYEGGQRRDVTGRFHGWGSDYEEFCDAGPGNFTVAIVEEDDGRIAVCNANTVRFLDREPKSEEGR